MEKKDNVPDWAVFPEDVSEFIKPLEDLSKDDYKLLAGVDGMSKESLVIRCKNLEIMNEHLIEKFQTLESFVRLRVVASHYCENCKEEVGPLRKMRETICPICKKHLYYYS